MQSSKLTFNDEGIQTEFEDHNINQTISIELTDDIPTRIEFSTSKKENFKQDASVSQIDNPPYISDPKFTSKRASTDF